MTNINKKDIAEMCIVTIVAIIAFVSLITFNNTSRAQNREMPRKIYKTIETKYGDTLWDIAQIYNNGTENNNVYISNIKKINNIKKSQDLVAGTNLIIYYWDDIPINTERITEYDN